MVGWIECISSTGLYLHVHEPCTRRHFSIKMLVLPLYLHMPYGCVEFDNIII